MLPRVRQQILERFLILETEMGAVGIHIKKFLTRDSKTVDTDSKEQQAHRQEIKNELGDLIFQATMMGSAIGFPYNVDYYYNLGMTRYEEKKEEYERLGRTWL